MNKIELINQIAQDSNLEKGIVEKVLQTFEKVVTQNLKDDKEVTLTGFGTFLARHRHARQGVNPQRPTEKINIPAVTVPKFKAGKSLKDALKEKRATTDDDNKSED